MKRKSAVLLFLIALVVVASTASAGTQSVQVVQSDLSLRPGVGQAGHPSGPREHYLGALDGSYNPATSRLFYRLKYKGLAGSVFRVEIRSRATGALYATLCGPCHPASGGHGREGLPVSKLAGSVSVDPDVGFLITGNRTSVEVDTNAYPAGEIGGPILRHVAPTSSGGGGGVYKPPPTDPRCC